MGAGKGGTRPRILLNISQGLAVVSHKRACAFPPLLHPVRDMEESPIPASVPTTEPLDVTERDIVFNCPHCKGELVVDKDGAGMSFECSHCGGEVIVPPYNGPSPAFRSGVALRSAPVVAKAPGVGGSSTGSSTSAEAVPQKTAEEIAATFSFEDKTREENETRFQELARQAKENASQRTEMRGHINRAQIEVHRMQLKLQRLVDRQAEIEGEAIALKKTLG